MRILVIGNTLNNAAIRRAAEAERIEVCFISSASACEGRSGAAFDAVLAGSDRGGKALPRDCALLKQPIPVAAVSAENIAGGIGNISASDRAQMAAYFTYGGQKNLRNGFRLLSRLAGAQTGPIDPPQAVPFNAIFTSGGAFYDSADAYFEGEGRRYPTYVGIVSYRNRWLEDDLSVEFALAESLRSRNIGVIMAFTTNASESSGDAFAYEKAMHALFTSNGKSAVDLLVDFQFFAAKAQDGKNMFDKSADFFAELDVPILRPAGLGKKTYEQWKAQPQPYAADTSFNFAIPEYQGMIEPIHVYCAGENGRLPIPERINRLTERICHWLALRRLPNREKRVAILLNNAPCAGVEATIGCASDLDSFESAVAILRRMKAEGYDVQNIPESGQALKDLIFEKKAFSDFRWTSVEDICASGGALYAMPLKEYLRYYDTLSPQTRQSMEEHWGCAPGEGMVLGEALIVTGISFGNALVMVQPKRGCYGAKCTGEVCKILHDPACPPPHQYLATYWYLSRGWKAQAVVHLGTHGSLECLPGKSCGLSEDCFPDIAIDGLVNLYPYSAAPIAQALGAKRRGYAATISYLPAPGKGLEPWQRELAHDIRGYFEAREQESAQAELLHAKIDAQRERSLAVRAVFGRCDGFDDACRELQALLEKTDARRKGGGMRAFGAVPDRQWICDYIAELWLNEPETAARFGETANPVERSARIAALAEAAIDGRANDVEHGFEALYDDARIIAAGLHSAHAEIQSLMHALSGGYIRPSRGGDAASGGREILPSGRNLHGGERDRIPTSAACERGAEAASALLKLHLKNEGRLPEKVAINMTSLDIVRTGGEQIGQCLSLLGVRPTWNASGTVTGLECLPLEALGRPRIDITVRISSVVRDGWPEALTLIDQAVQLAAAQNEPDEQNFVRANSAKIASGGGTATGRIFGTKPGTHTSAMKLALKASAWNSEEDLAKYFLDSSAYLYGEDKDGVRAAETFAENIRQIDATCDITSSRRYDAISSSYSGRVQGGYRIAAKLLGSRKEIKQYMGETSPGSASTEIMPLADHVARAVSDTLLNDVWREQVMRDGYAGASDLMQRIQNAFEIQCVCGNIPSQTIDKIVARCLLDEDMRRWFSENNPYALEESARRFLELHSRGKWNTDPDVLRALQSEYLRAEGNLEDGVSGEGEIQAGSVDVIAHDQVVAWKDRLAETEALVKKWKR